MSEREITIRNNAGIHCRPSGVILRAVQNEFPGHVFTVSKSDGSECRVDSILSLIALCLACGDRGDPPVQHGGDGPDEERALQQIGDLFEREFDFPPHD